MKKNMKQTLLLTLAVLLSLTACVESGEKQFDAMPTGPLRSYSFVQLRPMTGDTLMLIRLWREDTLTQGGLLTCRTEDDAVLAAMPQPLKVDESVFDSLYQRMADHRLYELLTWYKTDWKGDAYGYAPFTLEAEFQDATLRTESDGTTPSGFEYTDYGTANEFLENIFRQQGYAWLAEQPVSLEDNTFFSNLEQRFSASENGGTPLTFQLGGYADDSAFETFTLTPDGRNAYRDTKTGRRLCLQWAEDELMLICYSPTEAPLWTMSAHKSWYENGYFESQLTHVTEGTYTDNTGRKVVINGSTISGFQGKDKRRCVIYDYHEMPAERLHMGDYPDEEDFAFRCSQSGLNIYATEYERKDETDWDSRPTEAVDCLHRTGTRDFKWLHREFLDSYFLRYYTADERQQMLAVCDGAASPTAHDTWNAWLLRTFMDVVPFAGEADYK